MKKNNLPIVSVILGCVLFLFLGVVAFFATKKNTGVFDNRQHAATPNGVVTMKLQPDTPITEYLKDTFAVDVMVNTQGRNISGVAFRFFYPNASATTAPVTIIDADPNTAGVQVKSYADTFTMTPSVNLATVQSDGKEFIDFSATTQSTTGYSNTTDTKIATILFSAHAAGALDIAADNAKTVVTDKATGLDTLATLPSYHLVVADDTQVPVVQISSGLDNNAVTTSPTVSFSWTASDLPARPGNAQDPLLYSYSFDGATFSTFGSTTSATKVYTTSALATAHTFAVKAEDSKGNISAPTAPNSLRTFKLNLTPAITTINPTAGIGGSSITITGTNFGATKGTVLFGTIAAVVTNWTDTSITATVPANGGATVTVKRATDLLVSNGVAFTIGANLTINFNYQGIAQDRGTLPIHVQVKNGTTYTHDFGSLDAHWDTTASSYAVVVPLGTISTAATYVVWLKDTNHLAHKFTAVTLTAGTSNKLSKIAAADKLLAGDVNNDNSLTLDDFGALMRWIVGLTNSVTTDNRAADLNADNTIDLTDVVLLLSNYKQLELPGDVF